MLRWPHVKKEAAPKAHPLVRQFFQILDRDMTALTDVAERAGLSHVTLAKWKTKHCPKVDTLEAALNVVGYELRIVERKAPR